MKTLFATCAVVALSAGAASAAPIQFDLFSNPSQTGFDSFSLDAGGVNLTVSSISCGDKHGPNAESCRSEETDRWTRGVGVKNSRGDSHQVDGRWRNEYVVLSFDQAVTLDGAAFTYFSKWDRVNLYTENGSGYAYEERFNAFDSANGFSNASIHTYSFTTPYTGTTFVFGATGYNDSWKFNAVSVTVPAMQTTPVPLPAAGWMLLAGLGGIAAVRRKTSK